ncbi:hypothetical protein Ga0080559_TMP3924 [Salipiger profundus]|uniref:Uncharacterized protein n=1 Tax=Salipiger profundus TaxID=1229727 RepID=A0A1U7D9I1_9RHOB|nr:hypothetical protein Ga0080559_TMP3924 [Salipiger profundus]
MFYSTASRCRALSGTSDLFKNGNMTVGHLSILAEVNATAGEFSNYIL